MALANLRGNPAHQNICGLLEEAKSYIESARTEIEADTDEFPNHQNPNE